MAEPWLLWKKLTPAGLKILAAKPRQGVGCGAGRCTFNLYMLFSIQEQRINKNAPELNPDLPGKSSGACFSIYFFVVWNPYRVLQTVQCNKRGLREVFKSVNSGSRAVAKALVTGNT